MIRKATRADWPRISEIRLAVQENRLSNPASIASVGIASVGPLTDWLFDNSIFWVWEEDGAIRGGHGYASTFSSEAAAAPIVASS